MNTKKLTKRTVLFILCIVISYGIYYAWFAFPIISGFSAKNACSCVFLQGRTKEDIMKGELGAFPLSLGSIDVNLQDSSVSGSVFGLAGRKAIFRKGLGCTLINELPESTVRAQKFTLPPSVAFMDTSIWITGNQTLKTDFINQNQIKLDSALKIAFQPQFENKETYTRAVLVVHDGKIIAEKYAPGYNAQTVFLGWSMAKSITGALIGILVKDGKLHVSDRAPVAQWESKDDNRRLITIEHLLQQTSGLDYKENYSNYSSATNMLFYKGDMARYITGLSLKIEPGLQFYYSSGNSNLLSKIIRQMVGENEYHAFPYHRLFHKIGMYHTLLEPDASGTFVGSSYIFATARDYARFGYLYLNDGVWKGEKILPEGWVQRSVIAPSANKLKNYGYQFWLNGFDEDDTNNIAYPEAPKDMFMANGYGGQRIYIIPSKKLVMVRLGLNRFDEHRFIKMVLEAIK